MAKSRAPWILSLIAGAFLVGIALLFSLSARAPVELPHYGPAPAFSLRDLTGTAVTEEDLKGKVTVMSFFFTSCPATCPTVIGNVASLHRALANDSGVQFISVTVDPDTDTPEKLTDYARRYNADPVRWRFVRGDLDAVRALRREGFKLDSGVQIEVHTTRLVLIDARGEVRGYYQGTEDESVKALGRDIQILRAEGGTRASPA